VPTLADEDWVVGGVAMDVAGVVADTDGGGALVELGEGVDVVRLLDRDELDGCEPPEPFPFAHASGSTYCWSPAETPGHDAADAGADTDSPATAMTASQARLLRPESTGAVLQSPRARNVDAERRRGRPAKSRSSE
jgi:hypothetical protein